MKKFTLVFLVALLTGVQALLAQNIRVTGTVRDADGQPLLGAAVVVAGDMSRGTTTSSDGSYAISAPSNGMLLFSFVGMVPLEVSVEGRTVINVQLENDAQMIEELVVTGYGSMRKSTFTGAASVAGGAELAKKTDANFVKSLEGTIPGLQMNNSTGMPGVWGSVFVRGRGSLNSGTQPLYVIDGMPVKSDTYSMFTAMGTEFDPMSVINPTDIESVTVLKDAAATAIYGSRAANGVIVITTKKGGSGEGLNLTADIRQGFVSMGNNNMEFADAQQTLDLFAKGDVARGLHETYEEALKIFTDRYKGLGWDGVTTYDWMDAVTRKGYFQDYNLNASGRSGDTGYFISMGYLNSEGLVIGSGMERFSGRVNLDTKYKFLTLGASSSYSYATRDAFSQSVGGSMSSALTGAITSMLPTLPFYDKDGNYANINMYNPLALHDPKLGELSPVNNQTINLNPYLQVDFGKGIYAKTSLGVNIIDQREYFYWSAIYNPQGMGYNGLGMQQNSKSTVITFTNLLGWDYTLNEKHNIGLMLGQEMQRKSLFYDYYEGWDFPFAADGMRDLATAGSWGDAEYDKTEARLASYFFDGRYSYDDKYYLSASFRRDGSSAFGSDHRWGNFWSVGGRWRVTGEDFLLNNPTITNLSLRASYGTVGNQDIGWYKARGFYNSGYNYNSMPGMAPGSIPNPDLTWEVSKKFNVGIDLTLNNRINLTADFYNEVTDDALFEVPLSMTTGLTTALRNIGAIRNRGVEIALNGTILKNNDLLWTAYANITFNKNEVIRLASSEPILESTTIIEVGRPYRQFFMKEYAGVDRETGKPMWYKNENNKGDQSETTFSYTEAAQRYVGSPDPKVLGGLGTSLTWKNIDFSLAMNYRLGGKVYDSGASFTGFGMSNRTPLRDVVLNSWTSDNKDAKYPQYIYGDPNRATAASSRFVYSSNFLRVSNITLGYTLPAQWTKKALIQKARIYVSADNLYTFTASDFVGYNPDTYNSGVIAWQYPSTRTIAGGIQITF